MFLILDPFVGLVGQLGVLGDEPVEACALELAEPAPGRLLVAGNRRGVDRRLSTRQSPVAHLPALDERPLGQVVVAEGEQVERDEAGRGLLGEQPHPAGGGVDALLEGLEVESVAGGVGNDDLAVDDRAPESCQDRLDNLGEVAGHWLGVAAADLHLVAIPKDHRLNPSHFGSKHCWAGISPMGLASIGRTGRHWPAKSHTESRDLLALIDGTDVDRHPATTPGERIGSMFTELLQSAFIGDAGRTSLGMINGLSWGHLKGTPHRWSSRDSAVVNHHRRQPLLIFR